MKLNFNKTQCFVLPKAFYQIIDNEIHKAQISIEELAVIILSFRDEKYTATKGGYHPVEIRFEKYQEYWQCVYITDFSFQGSPYPELAIDIDVCFVSKQVYSLYGGWLNHSSSKEMFKLFINNFITYYEFDAYTTQISY